ncbi:MAG: ankyrin repeat domain-containing protein [Gemmatimonadaceae bacterium]|nr:ankyrin repeat domain-containing protein [Gemmatimonadaceae bacterium]
MSLHDGAIATTAEVWDMLVASRDGDLDRVKDMAESCPALLTCQYDYTSPLHFAVREGHLALVQYVVEQAGLDPECRNHPYLEPLTLLADDRGHLKIATFLRQSAAKPSLTRSWDDIGRIDRGKSEDQIRFQEHVDQGRHRDVEAMLQDHPEFAHDEDAFWGEGILSMPAKDGDRPMLELLLRYGARVPDVSKWAKEYYFKNYDSAAFLLKNGASANHQSWRRVTVLHDLVFKGTVRHVELLLDHGADINAIDEEYYSTPLGYAAHWGKRDMVRVLLERGADRDKAGKPWSTPLAWARRKGHADIESTIRQAMS